MLRRPRPSLPRAALVLTLLAAATLTACAPTAGDPVGSTDGGATSGAASDGTSGSEPPEPAPTDPGTTEPAPAPGDLERFRTEVATAIADAARTAGTSEDAVALVAVEAVTWSDGSLGCPEPDMMYTQALVDGYRIVLEVAGERVAYHGALGAEPARCDDPDPSGVVAD